jgi:hypothetical protein
MSGSGGGGGNDDTWRPTSKPVPRPKGGAGDGGREPPPDPCNITENTTLNSPDRTVLASLRVGDMLTVVFQPGPPRRLVAEQSPGVVAGSITSPSMLQIIQCISRDGHAYVAEVLSIRGAICQVRVRPR